jgi:H+-transporting ATPase
VEDDWTTLTADIIKKLDVPELTVRLDTDPEYGLAEDEVKRRRSVAGPNEVPEHRSNPVLRFLRRYIGLTPCMLEAAIVLSFMLGKTTDAIVIAALLTLNAILGAAQESKASGALQLLKNRLQIRARVLRGGVWKVVDARDLVPGDIIRLRTGDIVPADCTVLSGSGEIDQSVVTGESLAVSLEHGGVCYSGTTMQRGEVTVVVTLTGVKTTFGKAAELVRIASPKLHIEDVMTSVVRLLLVIVGIFLCIDIAVFLARGAGLLEILPVVLILLVSALPAAMPAVITITMAFGSLELTRRGVLVTRLGAAGDAAEMDVLCVDKTGTITANVLHVIAVQPAAGVTGDEVILVGALASHAANDDPLDTAFLQEAGRRSLKPEVWTVKEFKPFDQQARRTEAVVAGPDGKFTALKGDVAVVSGLCGGIPETRVDINGTVAAWAEQGARTLAVARRDTDGNTSLLGLVALADVARADAAGLIVQLRNLGISVKMITGDALPVARSVASTVGLNGEIVSAADLHAAVAQGEDAVGALAERVSGFAGVYPEDKYAVVRGLQKRGHIVGMTGDGVNDAPALRQAEAGTATSNATDVAKGAASAVLTTEGLGGLVDLVRVGRMIHQRILSWIMNKVVKTFQVAIFTSVAFLITGLQVVSTFDVVLLLFLVDFVTLTIATDNVTWSPQPDNWRIGRFMASSIGLGIFSLPASLGILALGMGPLHLGRDLALLQSYSFGLLFYSGMFTVLIVRERGPFWRSRPSRTMLWTILTDMVVVAVLLIVGLPGLHRLPLFVVAILIGACAVCFLGINDIFKRLLLRWTGVTR